MLEGGSIKDAQAKVIKVKTECWCVIRSRQKSKKYLVIARELAIQGPVDKWEEAEMLVREEVKKNGKTGAAKSEADKKIERSRLEAKLEAKKKAQGSKASKYCWSESSFRELQRASESFFKTLQFPGVNLNLLNYYCRCSM